MLKCVGVGACQVVMYVEKAKKLADMAVKEQAGE